VKEKGRSGRGWDGRSVLPGVVGMSVGHNCMLEMWSKEMIAGGS